MLPRNRSLVSWRPWTGSSMTWGFQRDEKIDAIAGLQTSHPRASGFLPASRMTSGKVFSFLTLMMLYKSAREYVKCGQSAVVISIPAAFISALKIDATRGRQPPHPVPALVLDLTSPMDLQPSSLMQVTTSAFVTL